jgi:predicted nucleic acid-binding protein
VKLALLEDGSDLVVDLWESNAAVVSSVLSYPEGRSAVAAARRARRLTHSAHANALATFERAHRKINLVELDPPLARRAGQLADDLRLGGADAVHLASALALGEAVVMVTWDRRLRRAAAQSGCAVAPVPSG